MDKKKKGNLLLFLVAAGVLVFILFQENPSPQLDNSTAPQNHLNPSMFQQSNSDTLQKKR